jgi:hypothetical protein
MHARVVVIQIHRDATVGALLPQHASQTLLAVACSKFGKETRRIAEIQSYSRVSQLVELCTQSSPVDDVQQYAVFTVLREESLFMLVQIASPV